MDEFDAVLLFEVVLVVNHGEQWRDRHWKLERDVVAAIKVTCLKGTLSF